MNYVQMLFYYLFSTLNFYIAGTVTQDRTFSKRRKVCFFCFILILVFFTAPFLNQITTVFGLIGAIFFMIYRTPQKLSNLISFFTGYLVFVCMDYLAAWGWHLFLGVTLQMVRDRYLFVHMLIFLPSLFLAEKGVQWLLHTKFQIQRISGFQPLLWGILGNLAVNVLIFAVLIIFGEQVGYSPEIITFNGILFLAVFLLSSALLTGILRIEKRERELNMQLTQYENLSSYTHEIEQLYQNMRSFKHDYIDMLSSMKFYIDEKNTEQLSQYFYTNILPMGKEMTGHDQRLGRLAFLKNDTVKSLIFSKILLASQKGINVEVEIREMVEEFPVKEMDLFRVLGIFLNNAIEAAQETDKKEITIAVISDSEKITILLRNSTNLISLPLSRLCERDISSKKNHSGIGLYTAENILNSYENVHWNFSCEMPYFLVELVLYKGGEK